MLLPAVPIAPSDAFWSQAACTILEHPALRNAATAEYRDWSPVRVVVPTAAHILLLKKALAAQLRQGFIPPRIMTLSGWLALQPPDSDSMPAAASERLMALYAELRQHGWLKKMFTARRNTDLLPLAQTMLSLCDELTQSLLPQLRLAPDAVETRWQAALGQLTPTARRILSDEAQLVWSIWKAQLDRRDPCASRFKQMMQLADHADAPLVWIGPVEPDAFVQAFLDAYGAHQEVLPIQLDWRVAAIAPVFAMAWPELANGEGEPMYEFAVPTSPALCEASDMEDEAQQCAQTIIDWLAAGKTAIAIIAQDRIVARRLRALLERAQVGVADETGWKLSTTRAAAAVAAWFDVATSRAETAELLDLLKSPYLFSDMPEKLELVMQIEMALRRANIPGGWEAVIATLGDAPDAQALLQRLAAEAAHFSQRKTLAEWAATTDAALDALGMRETLATDAAGQQVLVLFTTLAQECGALEYAFSLSEWRALLSLQLESCDFAAPAADRRVVMLPLNGARLRSFDAVLLVGADAGHLPSQPGEVLFFANAVRRDLGLATRESLHRQQLRDFAELLSANTDVVLSWQSHKNGEPNALSPWVARLQLLLARHGMPDLPAHRTALVQRSLQSWPPIAPTPAAPHLLPKKLSASAYNALVACPYQFFAERMLGLSAPDELSDLPQKRDYGDWLHRILNQYHEALSAQKIGLAERASLLREISESVFAPVLLQNPAALGFYVRWQKAMPAYIEWANERESQGWHFAAGEKWFEKKLQWPGGEVTLHGRIDRIDEGSADECAVLDYKTTAHPTLKKRLEQREDHQLAFYALIADRPVTAAHYVSLEPYNNKIRDVAAPNYAEWQHQLSAQIVDNLRAISQGSSLKAAGIEAVCQYCDVRGLCRKGAW